ncbi:DUF2059 domain-containing protein [Chitinimonas naiadis]
MKKLLQLSLGLVAALMLGNARADEVSAEKRQAIQELIDTMNIKAMMPQMMAQITAQSGAMMKQTASTAIEQNKRLSAAQRKSALAQLDRELPALQADFNSSIAKLDMASLMDEVMYSVYGKYFETQEIRDINAFYQSPTGKKLLAQMPLVMRDTMQITMSRMGPMVNEVMEKTLARHQADKP